ncbi:hypothetical protein [Agromyces sp. CCNWLW213]|uniref:hypothetical protein n=1 Tax=Agromyces sp. CCNWLW213 TaxID=3128541 RepID=UPI003076600B
MAAVEDEAARDAALRLDAVLGSAVSAPAGSDASSGRPARPVLAAEDPRAGVARAAGFRAAGFRGAAAGFAAGASDESSGLGASDVGAAGFAGAAFAGRDVAVEGRFAAGLRTGFGDAAAGAASVDDPAASGVAASARFDDAVAFDRADDPAAAPDPARVAPERADADLGFAAGFAFTGRAGLSPGSPAPDATDDPRSADTPVPVPSGVSSSGPDRETEVTTTTYQLAPARPLNPLHAAPGCGAGNCATAGGQVTKPSRRGRGVGFGEPEPVS